MTRVGSNGLSGDGTVAVGLLTQVAQPEGFAWSLPTGINPLGFLPGGSFSEATATNEDGTVIVGGGDSAGPWVAEAGIWTAMTGWTSLGAPPGTDNCIATDVSADGTVVVGRSLVPDSAAFRWTAATGMKLIGLPGTRSSAQAVCANGATVVGSVAYLPSGAQTPFRWTEQAGMVALGFEGNALDVSGDGKTVVGVSAVGVSGSEAFSWTASGGKIGLGDFPGGSFSSVAHGVSGPGHVIVGQGRTSAGTRAALWLTGVTGPLVLSEHLTAVGVTGHEAWNLRYAASVSFDGRTIVGHGVNPQGLEQSWMARLPAAWSAYCTAKVNSLGCTPRIFGEGVPSASNSWPFEVAASNVRNQKAGVFIYKVGGTRQAQPFQGGILCIGPSGIRRTIGVNSGGNPTPGDDCSGIYTIDFNAFAVGLQGGNPDPALTVPGQTYRVQAWGRDQGFPPPDNTSLSDALEVPIGP